MTAPTRITSLDELLAVPLPSVEVRLGPAAGVDPLRCAELTLELKRWLWLCGRNRCDVAAGRPVPSSLPILWCQQLLDEAWHTFILDTSAYQAFCDEHLGGFVHHEPGMHDGEGCVHGQEVPTSSNLGRDDVGELLTYVAQLFGPATLWNWYVRDGLAANAIDPGDLPRDAPSLIAGLPELLV